MNKINGRLLFSLGLVLLLAFLIYVSMGYNQLARLVPLVVLVPGLIAALIQFGLEIRAAFAPKKEGSAEESSDEGTSAKLHPQEKFRRELVGIGWLLAFFVMIAVLGQVIAIPLFVLIFMRFFGRESWRLSIAFAVLCWAFAYGIFVWGLRNELYPGLLLPMIMG